PHPDLGVQVFEKNCAACHRIGDVGQKIGPELDGIGNRGLDRILEDTLDPSRNVDQAYLASLIELDSGELLTGLKKGEEGELVLLADNQGEIIKISKDEIVDERTSKLSPMPSNVAADLGEDDFRNLMSFLLKQRVED
ncbi:MAG: c-type cytochrome, partial [Candidatus Omnitrophica bacterium]|nr:c-type cytochrome [Candidatus Omnitrophota bacterium]